MTPSPDDAPARLSSLAAAGFFLRLCGRDPPPQPTAANATAREREMLSLAASLDGLEQRPYAIRHAVPGDVDALVELEAECWEAHLQASRAEIAARLDHPACTTYVAVLRASDRTAAVLYTQRISSIEVLRLATFDESSRRRTTPKAVWCSSSVSRPRLWGYVS